MATLTIRIVSDYLHRALHARAAAHGRCLSAEVGATLTAAVDPPDRVRLGSLLADIGREVGLSDDEFATFAQVRELSPRD